MRVTDDPSSATYYPNYATIAQHDDASVFRLLGNYVDVIRSRFELIVQTDSVPDFFVDTNGDNNPVIQSANIGNLPRLVMWRKRVLRGNNWRCACGSGRVDCALGDGQGFPYTKKGSTRHWYCNATFMEVNSTLDLGDNLAVQLVDGGDNANL
eukprot:COSAG05_NODE_3303_length_2164_cov_2.003874_1_plen_152_part_10